MLRLGKPNTEPRWKPVEEPGWEFAGIEILVEPAKPTDARKISNDVARKAPDSATAAEINDLQTKAIARRYVRKIRGVVGEDGSADPPVTDELIAQIFDMSPALVQKMSVIAGQEWRREVEALSKAEREKGKG